MSTLNKQWIDHVEEVAEKMEKCFYGVGEYKGPSLMALLRSLDDNALQYLIGWNFGDSSMCDNRLTEIAKRELSARGFVFSQEIADKIDQELEKII